MKIGIVSDTHGCYETWRKVFEKYFYNADLILHAGDVLYHGPRNIIPAEYNPLKLARELNASPVPILTASGNCDAQVDSLVLDFPVQSPYTYVFLDGIRFVITHGHNLENDQTKISTAKFLKADIFITGHTHLAELEVKNDIIFLNPGSPCMSKREDAHGTIALFENNSLYIIDIATDEKIISQAVR